MTEHHYQTQKLIALSITLSVTVALVWLNKLQLLDSNIQVAVVISGLFISGIPHGALDHLVQERIAHQQRLPFALGRFLLNYLLLMVAYALLWYMLPQLSLALFLLLSAYHFGEADLSNRYCFKAPAALRIVYGAALLGWLLLSHTTETGRVLVQMIPVSGWLYHLWHLLVEHKVTVVQVCGLVLVLLTGINIFTVRYHKVHWLLAVLLLALVYCCSLLPLLPAFVLYFAGWHAAVTLLDIHNLQLSTDPANPTSLLHLWVKALPFTLVALAGLLGAGYITSACKLPVNPVPLLFIFLSLITLPHLNVMREMHKHKNV